MFRRARVVLHFVLLAISLSASLAAAQEPAQDRVQAELDMTDRRIEQANSVVSGTDDDRARLELGAAIDVQARARSAFGGSQYGFSLRLTLEARGHADRAIAIVRGLPDPDRVRAQIERTREMLDRARERIEECNNDRARAMLASALAMQVRSEEAADAGRYLAALQLTMSARERTLRALRLCNMQENLRESAERALHRTDDLLTRVQEQVAEHGTDAARAALGRAQQLEDQAWSEFRADHFDAALRLTQTARALAYRALRLAGGGA